MSTVISITNQKGGVAKTTTAIQLASGFARLYSDKKVLLIDLDSQRNASGVILKKINFQGEESIFEAFKGNKISSRQIHSTHLENLFMIPASVSLIEVESLLSNALDGFFRLSEVISKLKDEFTYIFIDCPPSLSVITVNSMIASDYIIVPIQTSKFSIDGIQGIMDAVETVQKRFNPHLKILGGVLSIHNPRTTLSKAVVPELEKKIHLFRTTIPKSVVIEEAHLLKNDLYDYAPKSKVALAYKALCDEVDKLL